MKSEESNGYSDPLEKKKQLSEMVEQFLQKNIKLYGIWKFMVILLIIVPASSPANLIVTFILMTPNHRCAISKASTGLPLNLNSKLTNYDLITNLTIPSKPKYQSPMIGQPYHPCKRYTIISINETNQSNKNLSNFENFDFFVNKEKTEKCKDGYIFDNRGNPELKGTLIEEFGIVCDRKNLFGIAGGAFAIGQFFGGISSGILSDTFGRKPTIVYACIFECLSIITCGLAPNLPVFIIGRLLNGTFDMIRYAAVFVLVAECSAIQQRSIMLFLLPALSFNFVGIYFLTFSVWLFDNWRYSMLLTIVPSSLVIFYWAFGTESPRWLISTKRFHQAELEINRAIEMDAGKISFAIMKTKIDENLDGTLKVRIPHEIKHYLKQIPADQTNYLKSCGPQITKFISNRALRIRAGLMSIVWIQVTFVYYLLNYLSVLKGNDFNVYGKFLLNCLTLMLGNILYMIIYKRCSRKYPIMTGQIVCLSLMILAIVLQTNYDVQKREIGLALYLIGIIGTMLSACMFTMIYTYSCELYPTELRTIGLGINSSMGRIGSSLAPQVLTLGINLWPQLPYLVSLIIILFAFLILLFLPNFYLNSPVLNTIDEVPPYCVRESVKFLGQPKHNKTGIITQLVKETNI